MAKEKVLTQEEKLEILWQKHLAEEAKKEQMKKWQDELAKRVKKQRR